MKLSSGYHRVGANSKRKGLQWDNRLFDPSQGGQRLLPDVEVSNVLAEGWGAPIKGEPVPVDEGPAIGFRATLKADPSTFEPGPPKLSRDQAAGMGYTGDQCSNCNSMRMKVSGHCMVCEDCGTTTGCS